MDTPPTLVFVYGTLKQGFPNHGTNAGRRLPGEFRTLLNLPLVVVRLAHEDRAPWLIDSPGQGQRVTGQVFEVDADTLKQMDLLEEVGQPFGYVRTELALEPVHDPGGRLHAHAYLKQAHQLAECLAVEGPFGEYTAELAIGYRLGQRAAPNPAGMDPQHMN